MFLALLTLAFVNITVISISVPRDQPKIYDCVLCKAVFECAQTRKEHIATHADPVTGKFSCTHCKKRFDEFPAVRKHIRAFHSDKQYPCSICQKVCQILFPH